MADAQMDDVEAIAHKQTGAAAAAAAPAPEGELPWVEKHRPRILSDIVGNADTIARLQVIAQHGNMPNLIIAGPPGTGKTTSVMCLAREMLGPLVGDAVLEMNASDARGIDVVRNKIKSFAQQKVTLPPGRHKIVILDEADSMTSSAQQALRRTMELFSSSTRFALACNCFPAADHELLTSDGFMKLYDVDRRLNPAHAGEGATLQIGCYVDGFLEYHPISWKDVVIADGVHQHVEIHAQTTTYMQGDVNHAVSNRVSLLPTSNHRMYARVGPTYSRNGGGGVEWRTSGKVAPPFEITSADELFRAGQADPSSRAQFQSVFEFGVRDAGVPKEMFTALRLETDDQVDAFLWLYGYWLGDGWLDEQGKIGFSPLKAADVEALDAIFRRLGLPRLEKAEFGKHGYWKAEKSAAGVTRYLIPDAQWVLYFSEQYGHKYGGEHLRGAAQRGAARRGGDAPKPRRADIEASGRWIRDASPVKNTLGAAPKEDTETAMCTWCHGHFSTKQRAKHEKNCTDEEKYARESVRIAAQFAEALKSGVRWKPDSTPVASSNGRQPKGPTTRCLWCDEHVADSAASRSQHKQKKCTARVPAEDADEEMADDAAAQPAAGSSAASASASASAAAAASPPPPDAEDIDSAKWFWYWVFRLSKKHARLVVAGLRFADGNQATADDRNASGVIYTSSARFKDELERLLLHAGFSPHSTPRFEVGQSRGVNQHGVEFIVRHQPWHVAYSDFTREAQPRIDVAQECKQQTVAGTVWCVTVPAKDNLIVFRRVLSTDEQGARKETSRAVIVGNTSSKIIEPIQSRCAILRFTRLDDKDVLKRVKEVIDAERIEQYTAEGLEAILFTAQGDLRNALNNLQSTYAGKGAITPENVFSVVDQPHPITVQTIISNCQLANVHAAVIDLRGLWEHGYAAIDIVGTLFRVTKTAQLPEKTKLAFIKEIAFTHMKIADGVNSLLQLTGLIGRLCQIALDEEKAKVSSA